jgi:hypothetical protein
VSGGTQDPHRPAQLFGYGALTRCGRPFQSRSPRLGSSARAGCRLPLWVLQPHHGIGRQATQPCWFGLLPFRSPLLRECSLFLGVLRCFSSPGSLARGYVFAPPSPAMTREELPHSGTPGSALAGQLPGAFRGPAAPFLGLRRLGIPRAPRELDRLRDGLAPLVWRLSASAQPQSSSRLHHARPGQLPRVAVSPLFSC